MTKSNLELAREQCTCGAKRLPIRWALAEAHDRTCPASRLLAAPYPVKP